MDFSSLPVFEPGEFLSGSYTGLYDTQKSGVDRPVKMKVERYVYSHYSRKLL